jgi:hypothetical protein
MISKLLIICFIYFSFVFKVFHFSTEEEKLVKNLFRGYNKLIRPVKNSSEFVLIEMDLSVLQLINVVSYLILYFIFFFSFQFLQFEFQF